MKKQKITKIVVSTLLIICALWVATPKVYIHSLLNHEHSSISTSGETSLQSDVKDDCDFDKYDSPVYFTIFKFIYSFIPTKPKEQSLLIKNSFYHNSYLDQAVSLRAPPVNA